MHSLGVLVAGLELVGDLRRKSAFRWVRILGWLTVALLAASFNTRARAPASFSWSHLYRLQDVIGTNLLDDDISMLSPDHIDLLARAFKAAWEYYFQPGRNGGVLECLARPALAEFLVGKLREGIDDEPSLAAAGLEFLFSLEDTQDEPIDVDFPSWGLHLENAVARFVPVGHVRLTF